MLFCGSKQPLCENVERLEIELKGRQLKKLTELNEDWLKNTDFTRFEGKAYLAGIYRAVCYRWFEFCDPSTGEGNVSRMDEVKLVDWDYFNAVQIERLPNTKPGNEIWQAKRAATKLLKDGQQAYLGEALLKYFAEHIPSCLFSERFKELCMNTPMLLAHTMAEKHFIADWLIYSFYQLSHWLEFWGEVYKGMDT